MNKQIVARLNIQYKDGTREAVEIHKDSTFSAFYFLYTYISARKKTALMMPSRSRTYHGALPAQELGLAGVLELIKASYRCRTNPVISSAIRVYQKRVYKAMLNMAPDELGMPAFNSSNHRQEATLERRRSIMRHSLQYSSLSPITGD